MRRILVALALLAAFDRPAAAVEWPRVRVTGFLQPNFQWISLDPQAGTTKLGFTESRARAYALGTWEVGKVSFDFRLEVEGLPQPSLFDAWIGLRVQLPGDGFFRFVVGQQKAPYSRQVLVWEPDVQIIGRSYITDLAPGHQLGGTIHLAVPHAPWIQLSGGLYNGDGRNVVENIDTNFMWVGRLAFRPWGALVPMVESAHGEKELSIAGNVSYNKRDIGDSDEEALLLGADAALSWRGLSAYAEFLYGQTGYTSHDKIKPPTLQNFHSIGYNIQAGYLLPLPGYLYRRFEIVGRFQGVVRNDVVPIANPGDPNQAHYDIVAGINYYQFAHSLKAMVDYHHYVLPDEPARGGKAAAYDAVFVQFVYKLE